LNDIRKDGETDADFEKRVGNIQAVRVSRVEIHLLRDQNVSIYADEEVCLSGRWFRYGCMERAGSHTGSPAVRLNYRPALAERVTAV
jgi:hypothetical protein